MQPFFCLVKVNADYEKLSGHVREKFIKWGEGGLVWPYRWRVRLKPVILHKPPNSFWCLQGNPISLFSLSAAESNNVFCTAVLLNAKSLGLLPLGSSENSLLRFLTLPKNDHVIHPSWKMTTKFACQFSCARKIHFFNNHSKILKMAAWKGKIS